MDDARQRRLALHGLDDRQPRRPGQRLDEQAVRAADSESAQEYTPFEGFELTAAVTDTFLRGERVLTDGKVTGGQNGRYLSRPYAG